MKVELTEKEIHSYTLTLEIEREGKTYRANVYYDTLEGYEVCFLDNYGKRIPDPEWVAEFEEELTEPLGYWLECQVDGFFTWGKVEANG